MNRKKCLVKWSRNRVDAEISKMIIGEETPSNEIWLTLFWRAVLPGS
jgi:hypothetical protein